MMARQEVSRHITLHCIRAIETNLRKTMVTSVVRMEYICMLIPVSIMYVCMY